MRSPDGSELDSLIRILDIMIFIGRYLVAIAGAIALLSIGAAIYSLYVNSFVGVVLWTPLSVAGIIFLIQILGKRRSHRRMGQESRPVSKYAGVAQA